MGKTEEKSEEKSIQKSTEKSTEKSKQKSKQKTIEKTIEKSKQKTIKKTAPAADEAARLKRRTGYAIAFLVLFLTEAGIAVFVHDSFIRPYIGDVLVVPVVYCLVRIVIPDEVRALPLYVFLFAAVIEILQYFHLVDLLGLSGNRMAVIILGSTFDMADLVCYGAGAVLIAAAEWMRKRN